MAVQTKRRGVERKKSKKASSAWLDDSSVKGWGNEVLALIVFAATLFLAATVIASAAHRFGQDSFIGSSVTALAVRLGPFGTYLGGVLVRMLGVCSVVPVAWLGWFGFFCWNLDEEVESISLKGHAITFLGAFLLLIFSCSLTSILFASTTGGAVGNLLGGSSQRILGTAGAVILHTALFIAALSLSTRKSIAEILESWWEFSKKFIALTFIIIPVYAARLMYAAFQTILSLGGFGGRAMTKGWQGAFSAPPPRKRNQNAPNETSDFELGVSSSPVDEAQTRELPNFEFGESLKNTQESECEELLSGDEEEVYSHVVVSRRHSTAGLLKKNEGLPAKSGKMEAAKQQEGDFSSYQSPTFDILTAGETDAHGEDDDELLNKSRQIEAKLRDFNIQGRVTEVHPGPVITLFEFEPAPGVKVGKIAALQDDLAMSLRATSIRIIAPIPKKGTVGIEIPNKNRDMVRLRDVLEHPEFIQNESILTVPLGKDTYGDPVYVDIAQMPHLLMAGATGTGKSVCINAVLVSLLYKASPAELGLILIDPKVLELSVYEGIPHLRVPVVTIPKQAKAVLDWAVKEMDRRYRMMQKFGVRNIDGYNKVVEGENDVVKKKKAAKPPLTGLIELSDEEVIENGTIVPGENVDSERDPQKVLIAEELKPLPKIIIVIDELADLMLTVGRDIEELITRLAQKARAAGIHLIVATQRPSVDVITGLIKANFPARLSFRVTSRIDSRTILDAMGAERLLGKGDMLFMQPGGAHLRRVHGAFISDNEVQKVVEAVKKSASPCYDQKILDLCEKALLEDAEGGEQTAGEFTEDSYDPLYDKAVELVVAKGQASTSMIQRVFRIGYNRAARIIEMMEREGVIGPMDGIKPREVLVQGIEDSTE